MRRGEVEVVVDLDVWRDIPGDVPLELRDIYDAIAIRIPPNGVFVQVGVGYGAGLAYAIGRFVDHARGPVRSVAIDTWSHHDRSGALTSEEYERVTSHGDAFEACIQELGDHAQYVFGRVTLIREPCSVAIDLLPEKGVDALVLPMSEYSERGQRWHTRMRPEGTIYTCDY